ncbi:MAG TPA: tryptophan synthase subunit alpha [Gemmatimonadaceae bacterium]|nr:tryptophan synthase subunit alpha [Gemmatimonadaceae bacterium]HRQ79048.1 tryptophan synthase subunit alpha [Gemmatimonadaceae bacterium]
MLTERLRALRAGGRRALVCYVTAGHPDPAESERLLRELPAAGCDVIEVGIPFSDPLADGPIIQGSSQKALAQGVTLERSLAIIAAARPSAPVVLFSYLNPLMKAGADVLNRAKVAGVSGVLVTDLPVGADPEREAWLGSGPLEFVRLVAPTTPAERMAEIAKHGSGFVYLISRLGVTGVHAGVSADLAATVARLRGVCELPICVGFGISTPEQARAVADVADGVVVGSALVKVLDEQGVDAALDFVRSLRAALDAR